MLVIGKGNVGQATQRSLPLANIEFHDPHKGLIVDDPNSYDYAVVCVDTLQSGPEDYADLDLVISYLSGYSGTVVIRSTLAPDKVISLGNSIKNRLIIFPEFMDHHDFKNQRDSSSRIVLGGDELESQKFLSALLDSGYPAKGDKFLVSPVEASLIKLSSNAALATKVTLFNAIYSISEKYGAKYELVRSAVGADKRIGLGHTIVPSPDDGSLGFGGHCLPKDIKAMSKIDSLGFFNFIETTNKNLGRQ
jgi:UDPglucose 6-dehydrogenase